MSKFMIHCSTSKSYWITVEAPSKLAAELWYENATGEEFLSGEEWGWDLSEIEELPPADPLPRHAHRVHLLLNEHGEEI